MRDQKVPQTLMEAIRYFSDQDTCISFFAPLRWPNGPHCPECEGHKLSYLKTRRIWKCGVCTKQFSVKVGTVFEDSPLGLDKWLTAMWMICNCKNGISSYEVARGLGITQKSAWFMLHRLRLAMQSRTFGKMCGHVEVDETFIGGKARNMHKAKRLRKITATGGKDKVAVMGLLERGGRVRTHVVSSRRKPILQAAVREHVEPGSALYTDFLLSYEGLAGEYAHQVVDHATEYVNGQIHTNGLENFWSLLKRGLNGTYISVEPFHLFRYLDEQTFRYNHRRGMKDAGRFSLALRNVSGKRLTYSELTGKEAGTI